MENDNAEAEMPQLLEVNIKEEPQDFKQEIKNEFEIIPNIVNQNSFNDSDDFSNFGHSIVPVNDDPLTYSDNSNTEIYSDRQKSIQCSYDTNTSDGTLKPGVGESSESLLKDEKYIPNKSLKHVSKKDKVVKKHVCTFCSKEFPNGWRLNRHINTVHEKVGPYQCNDCNKKFTGIQYLRDHINYIHNGIKKYCCEICKNVFVRKSHVMVHITSVHEKSKCHKCKNCQKLFSRWEDLTKHLNRVHLKVKNYKYENCNKLFYSNYELKRHFDSVHK